MKEIIEKVSSYNIFNYLFPGVVFVFIFSKFTKYSLLQNDILVAIFLYYFIGMSISRFGSIIIEPILIRIRFIVFADYKQFILASKQDDKINILSESNNTYRTLISTFVIFFICKLFIFLESYCTFLVIWNPRLIVIIITILFLFSYRKQTQYIKQRVENLNSKKIEI